ncbi:hypothetical protein N9811_02100 [Bacteroidia bacterium]|jgi:hypothetical protein|nr:hypothetical protein [Bacteroidota bacterium]MDA8929781.1 hypothetical protein [Bacteroidia bacterium]MDB4173580.1 hypothetical protein [Bacteroidia bacterium]
MVVKVKKEHIQKGIDKYKGERQKDLEKLFAQGNLKAEVYRFADGRMLVHYLVIDSALLYPNESALMDAIVLE